MFLKKPNVIVKQSVVHFLLKQEELQVLTADFTFLKNPRTRPPLHKSGWGELMVLEGACSPRRGSQEHDTRQQSKLHFLHFRPGAPTRHLQ